MGVLTTELRRTSTPRLIWRVGCAETMGFMRKLTRAAGYARPVGLDASDFPLPDSELASQATRLVRELSPRFLFNHGVRVFMFAEAIGRHNKMKYDREVVYLAAVMHDLGLLPQFNGHGSFEVEGAGVAPAWMWWGSGRRTFPRIRSGTLSTPTPVTGSRRPSRKFSRTKSGANPPPTWRGISDWVSCA